MLRLVAIASVLCLAAVPLFAEDHGSPAPRTSPTPKPHREEGAVYLDITTDKTGSVEKVEFLNRVPQYVKDEITSKIMGRRFGVPNHTYRRHVRFNALVPSR